MIELLQSYGLISLGLSIVAGSIIGLERTYHGRPAGFRTHTLVCMASAVLMQFTLLQWQLLDPEMLATVRVDPTRMAQGIMTGIGFLGAGVIIREGLTVRGLTTAASIWTTAAVGIIIGMGMYVTGMVATLAACGILSVFRWLERVIPSMKYGRLEVMSERSRPVSVDAIQELAGRCQIEWDRPSYHLGENGAPYGVHLAIRTRDTKNFRELADRLQGMDDVVAFRVQPTGD